MQNEIALSGVLDSDLNLVAEFEGISVYRTAITSLRTSGKVDTIQIQVTSNVKDRNKLHKGCHVKVLGELRSTIIRDELGYKRTLVYLQVHTIVDIQDFRTHESDINDVVIAGRLYKDAITRLSKTNKSVFITELLLCNNRGRKEFRVPAVCWYKNSEKASTYKKNDFISISGRFQSRSIIRHSPEDLKKLEPGVVYEVLVTKINTT